MPTFTAPTARDHASSPTANRVFDWLTRHNCGAGPVAAHLPLPQPAVENMVCPSSAGTTTAVVVRDIVNHPPSV